MAVAVVTVLLLAALFAGDSVWTALAALLAAGGWSALASTGRACRPVGGTVLLSALLAIAAWAGLSVAWSVAPDRSWAELDRTLVFAAFLVVGLLLGARGPSACRWAAAALVAALGAAVLWALAGKAVPALFPDGGRAARLRDPIGYWNALALAADVLLVLGLWLAGRVGQSRTLRAVGVVAAYLAVAAVLLSGSRTGLAGAVAALALWLLLSRARLSALVLSLAVAAPAAAVAVWAFTRPALVEDGGSRVDRVADGAWFGLLLIVGAAAALLASARLRGLGSSRGVPAVLSVLVLAATIGGVVLAIALGGSGASAEQGPRRFFDPSANNRLAWWGEAMDVFAADPLLGSGAGTFEVARKRYREDAVSTIQPHSVPLQFLAGTGLVGLALFAALAAAAATAAAGALRRLEGAERDAAAALSVALALWLAHALVDYNWDFVAVTGPVLFAAGALASAGRPARTSARPLTAAAVAALALAAAVSVIAPWLAERSVREVGSALDRGDLAAAADSAERARSLDPLSLAPLFARARVEETRRDADAALAAYREAVRLQPENPETWYQLGLYEFGRGDRCSAYAHLNEAYTLDPAGTQWAKGRELDQARAWVNGGNC